MAPFYRGFDPAFRLDTDDIQGIQTLYGRKSYSGVATTKRPTVKPAPPRGGEDAICKSPKIDAIFNSNDGSTFAFKGDKYYKLTENAIAEGYPKLISEGWPGLPRDIDAAFTYKNGKTYFFKVGARIAL